LDKKKSSVYDEQGTRRERDKKSCEEKLCDFDMPFNLLLWRSRDILSLKKCIE
jgi:hypothetical protein